MEMDNRAIQDHHLDHKNHVVVAALRRQIQTATPTPTTPNTAGTTGTTIDTNTNDNNSSSDTENNKNSDNNNISNITISNSNISNSNTIQSSSNKVVEMDDRDNSNTKDTLHSNNNMNNNMDDNTSNNITNGMTNNNNVTVKPGSKVVDNYNSNSMTMNNGRWSADEHKRFLAGLDRFGTGNWKKITEMVGTRSCTQIRTHAQKYFIALQKPDHGLSSSNHRNGGIHGEQGSSSDGSSGRSGSGSGGRGGQEHHHANNLSYGTRRNKTTMITIPDHSKIKRGSSAIITGYGGGGMPIHPNSIVPVASNSLGIEDEHHDNHHHNNDGGGRGGVSHNNHNHNGNGIINNNNNNNTQLVAGGGGQVINQFWGPDGLRDNNTGLTGMDVLAQAATTENTNATSSIHTSHGYGNGVGVGVGGAPTGVVGGSGNEDLFQVSSLDKAVAELRKKIAKDADAEASARCRAGTGSGYGGFGSSSHFDAKEAVAQAEQEAEAAIAATNAAVGKRKREEYHHHQQSQTPLQQPQSPLLPPTVVSSSSYPGIHNTTQGNQTQIQHVHQEQLQQEQLQQQQQEQQQHYENKKRKQLPTATTSSSSLSNSNSEQQYAAAVQETMDRKDVLEKLQQVAERQGFLRLRQEVKLLNQTIHQLQQQSVESDNRVMEAITDRRVALNECKNYQEINAQLKIELRRMVVIFEQTNKNTNNTQHQNNGNNQNNPNQNNSNNSSSSAAAAAALMAAATQNAKAELLQARLTESELRYHTVTESLSRQTGVLTDQHRAILELSTQLETERATRQAIEFELQQQLVSTNTTTATANTATATNTTNHAGGVKIQQ